MKMLGVAGCKLHPDSVPGKGAETNAITSIGIKIPGDDKKGAMHSTPVT